MGMQSPNANDASNSPNRSLTPFQMARSRLSLNEPPSHPLSPAEDEEESETPNGIDEETRGRTGKVSS